VPKRAQKKPGQPHPFTSRVLPMRHQVGDRFADETWEWEVGGRPYTIAGGKRMFASNGATSLPSPSCGSGASTNVST